MKGADGILAGRQIPERIADVGLRRFDPQRSKGLGRFQKARLAVENGGYDIAAVVLNAVDRDGEVRCSRCGERRTVQQNGN